MLKLNRLLFSTKPENLAFHSAIEPSAEQRDILFKAKNEIRDYLRPRLEKATVKLLGMEHAVIPRFRTQGSWSYKTCVQPAWNPPQEMDWDFGIYLPVTVWEDNGPPHAMAKLYFDLVEKLLAELCKEKGWTLFSGKATCIRVQLNAWAHIDLPLYAAPEAQFIQIVEKVAFNRADAQDSRQELTAVFDDVELPQQQWEDMTDIMMATRAGLWKPSDPEAVSKWFLDRILEHTEQLRRVCCYLKAWRDLQWKNGGGPTSVCIMIAVAQAFERHQGLDDIALESAARILSAALKGDVRERAIDDGIEDFNKGLDDLARQDVSVKAEKLANQIKSARLKATHLANDAIELIRAELGARVPHRVDLIEPDGGEQAVRNTTAERVSRPVVKSTIAG